MRGKNASLVKVTGAGNFPLDTLCLVALMAPLTRDAEGCSGDRISCWPPRRPLDPHFAALLFAIHSRGLSCPSQEPLSLRFCSHMDGRTLQGSAALFQKQKDKTKQNPCNFSGTESSSLSLSPTKALHHCHTHKSLCTKSH